MWSPTGVGGNAQGEDQRRRRVPTRPAAVRSGTAHRHRRRSLLDRPPLRSGPSSSAFRTERLLRKLRTQQRGRVTLATMSACSITRKPDGTIEARESLNPRHEGIYTKMNISGRCYLSIGIGCIPCGGGKALTCAATLMRALVVMAMPLLVGCASDERHAWAERMEHRIARDPAVCRIKSPQIAGSLVPLGGDIGLTALHVFRQPVAQIDGKLSGLDELRRGEGGEVESGDWVLVRVNDAELPAPDEIDLDHRFCVGSTVLICGFPSATALRGPGGPRLIPAVVADTPTWAPRDVRLDDVVFLDVDENPDLSGMSGGPIVVPDTSRTGWKVVGMYLGRWQYGVWTRYVARRLPKNVLEVQPTVPTEPR